jgi:hypothetical protein
MRCFSFFLFFLHLAGPGLLPLQAQTAAKPAGEYMLSGVMETAAGFNIKPDQTFEYGFTYGAADKWGKGTWKTVGSKISLTSSHAQPVADFILKKADASYKNGIVIRIADDKGHAYPYVECRLGGEGTETAKTDEKGEAHFATLGNGLLELYHPIFSLRLTTIQLKSGQTSFLISPVGDLSEVFFKDFEMTVAPGRLTSAKLPGMPPQDAGGQKNSYEFLKQK